MAERTETALFSTVATIVHGRTMDPAQMLAVARDQRAVDPSIFADHPPYFVSVQMSNNAVDSYFTQMHESTLKNFAADADAGVSVQDSHMTGQLGFGQSVSGRMIAEGDTIRTESEFYTIPGLQLGNGQRSDDFILGIKSGIYRDVSVGFYLGPDGRYVCSVCGGDPTNWAGDCSHWPGEMYDMTNDQGDITGQRLATAWVHGGRLSEYSMVYDGSTPGAGVIKAQRAIAAGDLSPERAMRLERMYRVALPGVSHIWPSVIGKHEGGVLMPAEKKTRDGDVVTAPVNPVETPGTPVAPEAAPPAVTPQPDAVPDDTTIETTVEDDDDTGDQADASVTTTTEVTTTADVLAAERVRLATHGIRIGKNPVGAVRALADEVLRLRPLADDGSRYRADLVEDALKEAIRADLGTSVERYRTILSRSATTIDEIKGFRDDWRATGDKRFAGGRMTRDDGAGPHGAADIKNGHAPDKAFTTR